MSDFDSGHFAAMGHNNDKNFEGLDNLKQHFKPLLFGFMENLFSSMQNAGSSLSLQNARLPELPPLLNADKKIPGLFSGKGK